MRYKIPVRPIGLSIWADLANSLNQLILHRLESIRVKNHRYTFSALDALCRLGYVSSFQAIERTAYHLFFKVSLRLSAGVPVVNSFRAVGAGAGNNPVLVSDLSKAWHSPLFRNSELLGFVRYSNGWVSSLVGFSELYPSGQEVRPNLFSAHLQIVYC